MFYFIMSTILQCPEEVNYPLVIGIGITYSRGCCLLYVPHCIIYVVSGLIFSTFPAILQSMPHLEWLCLAFPKGQPSHCQIDEY